LFFGQKAKKEVKKLRVSLKSIIFAVVRLITAFFARPAETLAGART